MFWFGQRVPLFFLIFFPWLWIVNEANREDERERRRKRLGVKKNGCVFIKCGWPQVMSSKRLGLVYYTFCYLRRLICHFSHWHWDFWGYSCVSHSALGWFSLLSSKTVMWGHWVPVWFGKTDALQIKWQIKKKVQQKTFLKYKFHFFSVLPKPQPLFSRLSRLFTGPFSYNFITI